MNFPGRRTRHNSQVVEIDGLKFHSKLEGKRYTQLKLLEHAGIISRLRMQVKFPLHCGDGDKLFDYIIDFTYFLTGEPIEIAEDVKGFLEYHTKIKFRWAQKLYPEYEFKFWPEEKTPLPRKKAPNKV